MVSGDDYTWGHFPFVWWVVVDLYIIWTSELQCLVWLNTSSFPLNGFYLSVPQFPHIWNAVIIAVCFKNKWVHSCSLYGLPHLITIIISISWIPLTEDILLGRWGYILAFGKSSFYVTHVALLFKSYTQKWFTLIPKSYVLPIFCTFIPTLFHQPRNTLSFLPKNKNNTPQLPDAKIASL